VEPGQFLVERMPYLEIEAVADLYRSVGWTVYADDPVTLSAALDGSACVAAAWHEGQLVGLARVVSDGATICYLQDVVVRPEERNRGIGRALVSAVLEPYASVRQKVLLTEDEPGLRVFYESLGFAETRDFGDGRLRAFVRYDG
jgi:GNAT superfamily N-acetyltransferase